MEKTAEELYREREKRVAEAIRMQVPNRVPLEIAFGYFPSKYTGITCQAAYYDYDGWLAACEKPSWISGRTSAESRIFSPVQSWI
jgi:hypothetical protein